MYEIPSGFWRALCQDVDHPLACVDKENRFTWVNTAFELLVGYSVTELQSKTWMDITVHNDIGGDLASVQAVLSGQISQYSMAKSYRHKRGNIIPIDLTVRRFPVSMLDDLLCFRVEAAPSKATRPELEEFEKHVLKLVSELRGKIEHNEHGIHITNMSDGNQYGDVGGDKIGGDKNSDNAIKFIAGALIAMALVMAWLMYYVASVANKAPMQAPPSIPSEVK